MTLLGTLLKNRRGSWSPPPPETIELVLVVEDPHRYTFQVFALSSAVSTTPDAARLDRVRPRALLSSLSVPVIARGRLTGDYEC